jgi:sialate O-acetylesterase
MKIRFLIALLLLTRLSVSAQITMPEVFGDHMVLQRDLDIPVWGNAPTRTAVIVEFNDMQVKTLADETGKWNVYLPKCNAGGPYKLIVYNPADPTHRIEFTDVLVGDVWLASGQSNMELQVQQANNAKIEISRADYPNIRFFNVPHRKSVKPETDIPGGIWKLCDSANIKTASAVAYYFARKIHKDMNVPVGIVQTTWGGTPVEAWTSRDMLLSSDITKKTVLINDSVTPKEFVKDSLDLIRFWDIVYKPKNKMDKIIPNPSFDDSKWEELNMPRTIKHWRIPFYEGIVWLRKTVELPGEFAGKDLILSLGHPEMNYSLYFNGTEICRTVWNANPTHVYTIPAKLLKKAKNIITVRMSVLWGGGGFNPPAEEMYLTDGNGKIRIDGSWKYKKDLEPAIPKIHNYQYYPSYMYNAMLHPIIPYGLKGILWYQGEANDTLAYNYRTLFPMMINDWRIRWKQAYLPFLYVQLPNYKKRQIEPMESEWAELREAQGMALALPNTAMACTIDLGVADNIHPTNKQDVGNRLALLAEKDVYSQTIVASGPFFAKYRIEGNSVILSFKLSGSSLKTKDNLAPREFTLAGVDKKFYRANAQLINNEVVISSKAVAHPVAIRYAWSDNPDVNLINVEGFPAVPFRTDQWDGITKK